VKDVTLEYIETKIAFLEGANAELSEVVYRQQREIDQLRAQLAAVASQFDELKLVTASSDMEPERPPHY
jgi:SlyX protein